MNPGEIRVVIIYCLQLASLPRNRHSAMNLLGSYIGGPIKHYVAEGVSKEVRFLVGILKSSDVLSNQIF